MATSTPNFGWQLPVPNSPVDANVWGTELNGNISSQDTLLLSAFTNNIGPTAPVAPILTAGSTWINNTNAASYLYYIYDGSQWVQIGTIDPVAHVFIPVGVGSGMVNVQIFTASGTYTPSAGLTYAVIEGVGGGGGGAGVNTGIGGGGGAGAYFWTQLSSGTIGASQAITIGSGGAGGIYPSSGGTGGTTSFGSICVANGGGGCTYGTGQIGTGAGPATGGLINLPGSDGGQGAVKGGAGGAAAIFGASAGGAGLGAGNNGKSGYGYGSGGSGAFSAGASQSGGPGSSGIIRIVEYL